MSKPTRRVRKATKPPASLDPARAEQLRQFAAWLRGHLASSQRWETTVDYDFAWEFVKAIRSRLAGRSKSLDHAIGLLRRPGNPTQSSSLKLAKEIHLLRTKGLSFSRIASDLADRPEIDARLKKDGGMSEENLRKIDQRQSAAVIRSFADDLAQRPLPGRGCRWSARPKKSGR